MSCGWINRILAGKAHGDINTYAASSQVDICCYLFRALKRSEKAKCVKQGEPDAWLTSKLPAAVPESQGEVGECLLGRGFQEAHVL